MTAGEPMDGTMPDMGAVGEPVFRFAPSPNGHLHLGHALSAILNHDLARANGGRFLVRLEDIDTTRCTPELEADLIEDLAWLGIVSDGPVMRQSERFDAYAQALDDLREAGLVYPAFMSRRAIREAVEARPGWPHDPDGAPHYPGGERGWSEARREAARRERPVHAWRLDMARALDHAPRDLRWDEEGAGPDGETGAVRADPAAWGDVVIARSDVPTSYHLAVVTDDAAQGISHVVRGRDLFHATCVHRLLQSLLGLPAPVYVHHDLILGEDGRKLSKSARDTSLRALREAGITPGDIRRMVGLPGGG